MQNSIFYIFLSIILLCNMIILFIVIRNNIHGREILKKITLQSTMILKLHKNINNKFNIDTVTNKAEIIYQDLLQHLIPIMAAINVMPRATTEHPLWRALGGILDEYAQDPFVLEKLRRAIKLDSNVDYNVTHYLDRSNAFLQYLSSIDTDGILATTFSDGLLGQSLNFFAQAKTLANTNK